jgi:transcriptional regulator GlxA family with amidase domain
MATLDSTDSRRFAILLFPGFPMMGFSAVIEPLRAANAAERDHGQAQLMLGRYLDAGAAGELDPAEARTWLERAAAQGIAEAEQDLAGLSP